MKMDWVRKLNRKNNLFLTLDNYEGEENDNGYQDNSNNLIATN